MRTPLACIVALLVTAATASAQSTIEVTTTSQSGPGCTLTDAIHAINLWEPFGGCPTGMGVGTIHVPAGTYTLTDVAVDEDGELTGLPYVRRGITIVGDGPGLTVIQRSTDPGTPQFRIFKFQAPFSISNMTLRGGHQWHARGGGAILAETFNVVNLPGGNARMVGNIDNVVFDSNYSARGGAVADTGAWYGPFVEFNVSNSEFLHNRSVDYGGGMFVSPGSALNLRHSRFEDNDGGEAGGGVATLTGVDAPFDISDSTFLRNHAVQSGGAIYNTSPVLRRVVLRDNNVRDGGGALGSYGGRPTIIDSTFEHNWARKGGAVDIVAGSVEISGSTFTGNLATNHDGGALWLDDRTGTSRIVNSTFSGNRAFVEGTAISIRKGGLTLVNATITGNTTSGSWGAALRGYWDAPTLIVSNSIIAGNSTDGNPLDIYVDQGRADALVSLGYNLIGNDEGTNAVFVQSGDQVGTAATPLDPGLLPLADNGGPTPTHALSDTSLALDGGSTATPGDPGACEATDQRGNVRPGPGSSVCDIGAFERDMSVVLGGPTTIVAASSPNPSSEDQLVTITAVVTKAPGTVGIPTGHVMFVETILGTFLGSPAIDVAGNAHVSVSTLPAGLRTIQATYQGDGLFTSSTDSVFQTVTALPSPTITTVSSSPNPSTSGSPVTLTATVASISGAVTPAGSVSFFYLPTNSEIGSDELDAAGTASIETSSLAQGTFAIEARYVPAGHFVASANTLTQVVQPPATAAIRNGVPENRPPFNGVGTILAGPGHNACTATMITPLVILTAAHCLRDDTPDAVFDFSPGDGRVARLTGISIHPEFQTVDGLNLAFDVALARLDETIAGSWTDLVPATVSTTAIGTAVNATAVGFGGSRTSGTLLTTQYLAGEGPIGVVVADAFIEVQPADAANQMFCLPGAGGPLFDNDQIAGIASFRFVATCAEEGPGYYVSMPRLAEWIVNAANELEHPAPSTLQITVRGIGSIAVNYQEPSGSWQSAAPCAAGSTPCTYAFTHGTAVQLQPAASGIWHFARWESCAAVTGSECALLMNTDTALTAIFEPTLFHFTLTVEGNGAVALQGSAIPGWGSLSAACSPIYACGFDLPQGMTLTMDATAPAGNRFANWVGCPEASGTHCVVPSLTSALTVTARFEPILYDLTLATRGGGTVVATPEPSPYAAGTEVTLVGVPASGFQFAAWTGCDAISGTQCLVTMNASRLVLARFSRGRRPSARITLVSSTLNTATHEIVVELSALESSDPDGPASELRYRWQFDGQTSTEPTISLSGLGQKTVTLTVTDATNLQHHVTRLITLLDRRPPVIAIAHPVIEATILGIGASHLALGVTAEDDLSGPAAVTCYDAQTNARLSGLLLGITRIRCEAYDHFNNVARTSFTVKVINSVAFSLATTLKHDTVALPNEPAQLRKSAKLIYTRLDTAPDAGQFRNVAPTVCASILDYRDTLYRAAKIQRITLADEIHLRGLTDSLSASISCQLLPPP